MHINKVIFIAKYLWICSQNLERADYKDFSHTESHQFVLAER